MKKVLLISVLVALVFPLALHSQRKHISEDTQSVRAALFQEQRTERKSVMLAVAASLLLPGMGELYAGSFQTGRYALIADGALWITYAGFDIYGNWLRNDAREFAARHANVNFNGKDEKFEVNIGNYMSTDSYNEAKLRSREYSSVYNSPPYDWSWDNDGNRQRFRVLRIQSDQVHQNGKFVIAALVINRVISAFSAGRAASAYNRSVRSGQSWRLGANIQGRIAAPSGLELRVEQSF